MTPAEQIALWADRLRDLSAMGLRFAENVYQAENYQTVQDIALAMLALVTNQSPINLEPLRETVFSRPTPLSTGDAAIIDDQGRLLLIRRADNGKWAMPGGALQVGETPAEGVAREAFEETGVRCRPVSLIGVFDSRLHGLRGAHHLYMFTFLCQKLSDGHSATPSHAVEVTETGWFSETNLPDNLDPGHASRLPAVFRAWRGDTQAHFDPITSGATDAS